jgi:DNA-binding transcriptional ArsR family regulator
MDKKLKQIAYLKLLRIPEKSKFLDRIEKEQRSSLFNERLVFSQLGYCDRIGRSASKRQIAEETGLSPRTVEKSLSALGSMVIINKQRKWSPVTPDTDWFGLLPDPDGDHWYDKYQYVKLYLPRKGGKIQYEKTTKRFGLSHSAVYSQLISLAGRSSSVFTTETGLSKLLNGINRKTIATVLNDIDHIGLISREKVGNHLRVQLLPLTDDHLLLFRQIPKGEKIAVKAPKPPADPNHYEFKGDNYDDWRILCKGLMAQSYAEKAIKISVELMESYDCFHEFLLNTKKWHEENRKKGKVTKGNFGRFFVVLYEAKKNKRREDEAEEKRIQELYDYWDSDKYQAKVEAEQEAAAADPLHKYHNLNAESITSRVCFNPDNFFKNQQEAECLINKLNQFIKNDGKDELDSTRFNLHSFELTKMYLCHALARVNKYYNSDEKATPQEFILEINRVLKTVKRIKFSEFQWVSKMEKANEQPSTNS